MNATDPKYISSRAKKAAAPEAPRYATAIAIVYDTICCPCCTCPAWRRASRLAACACSPAALPSRGWRDGGTRA